MAGERVLLVDDEADFTENMTTLLEMREYRVSAVDSGAEAIRVLEEEEFDVVVLDLKMPGMDGIATLEEIGKMGLFCQVLVLTGHGSVDTALEAMKLGAYDYLAKPCEIDELVEKIEEAGEKKSSKKSKDLDEKIRRVIESPRDALSLFPGKK